MSQVFVSYKRVDKDKVFPIVRQMESKLGIKFWVDLVGIESYDQFSKRIIKAINECDVFLFMFSKAHEVIDTENDWTVKELNYAYEKKKRIVWVELESCKLYDWFIFKFPDKQVVKAYDEPAMIKLIEDIRKSLRFPQQNSSLNHQRKTTDTVSVPTENTSHPQTESTDANKPHPQAIDLALPSGTKWASCNVGADRPEAPGCYYAWGETKKKDYYDWRTYIHCSDDNEDSCYDLGSDIANTIHDVAHMIWRGKWRLPTIEQFKELLANCTYEWTTLNGVNGCKFTSKFNGNSIFLPAAGYRLGDAFNNVGNYGYYWSSTQFSSKVIDAYGLGFDSGYSYWYVYYRSYGRCVRPVLK